MKNKYVDPEKVLEVLLYISKHTDNLFNILKTFYFADKLHIERYGIQITGDFYVAMEDGPVPSAMYDIIKIARNEQSVYCDKKISDLKISKAIQTTINKSGHTNVSPLRDPDPSFFSDSNIECLDEAISQFASMKPLVLWEIVHKENTYNETELNRVMSLKSIVLKDIPHGEEILEYLNA